MYGNPVKDNIFYCIVVGCRFSFIAKLNATCAVAPTVLNMARIFRLARACNVEQLGGTTGNCCCCSRFWRGAKDVSSIWNGASDVTRSWSRA
jgi:hypothetical protein